MKRIRRLRVTAAGLAVAVLASLLAALAPATVASAANNSSFDPGYIISDQVFFNKSAMSATQIAAFFVEKNPTCVSALASDGTDRTCLADFSMKTTTKASNENCAKYTGKTESAASIIYRVAQACGISPQVILVTLQKEQGFITGGARSELIYRKAMGMGCPDTSVCNSKYYGFFNQVYQAAWQFKQYGHSSSFKYKTGKTYSIPFHTSSSCGTSSVYIRNKATAALYNYTPYQPNGAALRAGSATGDACSSYGNRNFWRYFTDWFGNPANLLTGASFDGSATAWERAAGASTMILKSNDSRAQAGTGFLSAKVSTPGSSIARNVSRSFGAGQSFTSTVWVRSSSDTERYQGVVTLKTLGGSTETVVQSFDVGAEWQPVTLTLDAKKSGHTGLRLLIKLNTPTVSLFIDSVSIATTVYPTELTPVVFRAPSFEKSTAYWAQYSGSAVAFAATAAPADRPAHDGAYYLTGSVASSTGSLQREISKKLSVGQSYTATAWVRSSSATESASGRFALGGVGGSESSAVSSFVAGAEWTKVQTTFAVTKAGHTKLRLLLFFNTPGVPLEVDDITIAPNLIVNPSFETSATAGWFESAGAGGGYVARTVTSAAHAADGVDYLQISRSNVHTTRFTTDISRALRVGETFTLGGWFRSSTGQNYSTRMRLLARDGASAEEVGSVAIDVGPEWTWYETSVTLTSPQQTLRAEISVANLPYALEVDGLLLR